MSETSPARTPAWTAAPRATTSSGLTVMLGAFFVISFTRAATAGIRVEPPTRITSEISDRLNLASRSDVSTGTRQRSIKSEHICSNLARVSMVSMCLGPSAVAVMKGRLMAVWVIVESSIFAFSAASVNRCNACLSPRRSMPSVVLKSSAKKSTMRLSKSSPPRCVSPHVESTSNTPSPTSRTETSNVPPPRSNTRIVSFDFFSKP
mmetsp:Transcript_36437/g.69915  ORF Transcript_36437/g.69915 Transcript_36437/m.69915 type:complete len:206 (+) Transcript_36437:1066-1683(+)